MSARTSKKPHGQLRQSQVVTTFGPGSMMDLPHHSVLIGGLDEWSKGGEEIHEARLVEKLKRLLDLPQLRLVSPPSDTEDPLAPRTGIPAWQFPEWFIAQDSQDAGSGGGTRSRRLVHRKALVRGKYPDADKKLRPVVPVRFVRACRAGHIADIDWHGYVHRGGACKRQLWIDERGTSGDLSEIWVRCECGGAERPMLDASRLELQALGLCDGSRPWLGAYSRESCGEPSRLLVRTASNAYFPQTMSVISLPSRDEELVKAVTRVWEGFLQYVDDIDELRKDRKKKPPVQAALGDFSDEAVFAEIQARRGGDDRGPFKSVKVVELETLQSSKDEIGEDRPEGDFYARALPRDRWDKPWMKPVERVVLIHRLREVVAQVGFTRFDPLSPDIEGELEMGVRRAALSREVTWLPAIENRGEGIFLAFSRQAIDDWARRATVVARGRQLASGFDRWRNERRGSRREFPGLPYILLHSFSHLLITAVSLECGYPASSIRERVYALHSGYGILLYTGSPDAEGTLGGLVEAGRQIHWHMRAALELAALCSNDPVCAQHEPENPHDRRFLLGTACHGCLLIAETSCEQHNDFLDRALIVPTVEDRGAAFFQIG